MEIQVFTIFVSCKFAHWLITKWLASRQTKEHFVKLNFQHPYVKYIFLKKLRYFRPNLPFWNSLQINLFPWTLALKRWGNIVDSKQRNRKQEYAHLRKFSVSVVYQVKRFTVLPHSLMKFFSWNGGLAKMRLLIARLTILISIYRGQSQFVTGVLKAGSKL